MTSTINAADKELWIDNAREAEIVKWIKDHGFATRGTGHIRIFKGESQRKFIFENPIERAQTIARWERADRFTQ